MSGYLRTVAGMMFVVLGSVGSASCASPSPTVGPVSEQSASGSASSAAELLEGVWSTGPVPIEDIHAAMLAAGLDEEAVEEWVADQHSPPKITFELRFDAPDFSHSRVDAHFPRAVDESGTYVFAEGQLRLSLSGSGDVYVFDARLSDNALDLELVAQKETGTVADRVTHRLYTVALYASAPFVRQP